VPNKVPYHEDILFLTKHRSMKIYEGVEVYFQAFLTSALDGGEWSSSHPGLFAPGPVWTW